MTRDDVQTSLLEYVRETSYADVEADSDLIESGYVDSLLVMDLVLHIGQRFEVTLGAADLAPRNFRSISSLTDLILSRRAA